MKTKRVKKVYWAIANRSDGSIQTTYSTKEGAKSSFYMGWGTKYKGKIVPLYKIIPVHITPITPSRKKPL